MRAGLPATGISAKGLPIPPLSLRASSIALALALASSACGIGYGQKTQSTTIGRYDGAFNIDGDPSYEGTTKFRTTGHSVTLYDTSGILLSTAGGAGAAYTAREQAKQAALDRGAQPGDSYSYEYQIHMPVPNKLTTLSYSWGDTKGVDNSMADGTMATASYFELDLTARPKTWFIGKDDLTLQLSANWQEWTFSGLPGQLSEESVSRIGMPIGLSYGHLLIPHVQVSGRLAWDPLSLFTFMGEKHHADYTAGVHVSGVLLSWLRVEADASYQRIPAEFGKRDVRELTANVNLVLWWNGPEFWKKTH